MIKNHKRVHRSEPSTSRREGVAKCSNKVRVSHAPPLTTESLFPVSPTVSSPVEAKGIHSSEKISLKNIVEAIKLGLKCFPLGMDRAILVATYAAYTSGLLRTLPDLVLGGFVKLDIYQLHRDKDGKAIAISGLYRRPFKKDTLWLGWLGVDPKLQGFGIGSKLVEQLEKASLERGAKFLRAYMAAKDNRLLKFYQKLGFVQEGEDKKTKLSGTLKILKKELSQPAMREQKT